MAAKVYISNIATGWPVARQEALLAERVPGWPAVTVYRDILDVRARQAHNSADLVNREAMLRPTRTKRNAEIIYVASLSVLAWGRDFSKVLAAAEKRGAAIVSLEETVPVSEESFKAAKIQGIKKRARENGTRVAADRRAAAAEAKAKPFKEKWRDPSYKTAYLLEQMGLSRNTASKYLGRRELVLKRVEATRKRAATIASKEASNV